MKQILVGVQDLLDNPNNDDAANQEAYSSLKRSKEQYKKRVIEEVGKYREELHGGQRRCNRHHEKQTINNFLNID